MKLFTQSIRDQLVANGQRQAPLRGTSKELDFFPVVKLFTPDGNCTWLLTEIDSKDPDIAFGLCDLGHGHPELGNVRLSELEQLCGPMGLPIERDRYFTASMSISAYAAAARHRQAIQA